MRGSKRFFRGEEGIAYLEFAIALPFLLMLFLGAVEMTRYIIIVQKVEKAAVTMSDVVAQSTTISASQLDTLVEAVGQIVKPYSFDNNGYVIISSVSRTGANPPKVKWQYSDGDWPQASQIGITGSNASLPAGLTLEDKENIIIAEVYFNFSPLLTESIVLPGQIYKLGVFKPRLGDLTSLGS